MIQFGTWRTQTNIDNDMTDRRRAWTTRRNAETQAFFLFGVLLFPLLFIGRRRHGRPDHDRAGLALANGDLLVEAGGMCLLLDWRRCGSNGAVQWPN